MSHHGDPDDYHKLGWEKVTHRDSFVCDCCEQHFYMIYEPFYFEERDRWTGTIHHIECKKCFQICYLGQSCRICYCREQEPETKDGWTIVSRRRR